MKSFSSRLVTQPMFIYNLLLIKRTEENFLQQFSQKIFEWIDSFCFFLISTFILFPQTPYVNKRALDSIQQNDVLLRNLVRFNFCAVRQKQLLSPPALICCQISQYQKISSFLSFLLHIVFKFYITSNFINMETILVRGR